MKLFVDKNGYLNKPEFSNEEKIILPQNTKIIGDFAFECYHNLKEIQLPENIKNIGERAFYQCTNLETINLPKSLINIENNAFEDCFSLQSITLPENVDYIKEMTFLNCRSLKKIELSKKTTSISDFAFKNCEKLKEINLPKSLQRIGAFSFINCYDLQSINFPKKLKLINYYSFANCISLNKISIPPSVEIIKEHAFFNCENLETIYLPKSLETIEENAFSNCQKINMISLFNATNLLQKGLKKYIKSLKYAYINKNSGELILTKKNITSKKNFETINTTELKEYLNCTNEEAIVISTYFSIDELKENKMKFIGPLIRNVFLENNYLEIINSIQKNNKEFSNLYKKLYLNTYFTKKLLSEDNIEIYSLFKFAYNLGAFSENQIERQKACEYISNLFDKNLLDIYTLPNILKDIKIQGYNQEWANFIMDKKNTNLLFQDSSYSKYVYRSYNEFNQIKEFSRSNKGSQHYNLITIDSCKTYFSNEKFEGVSSKTQDIADLLSKFTRRQSVFDDAKKIREEYIDLKKEGLINDHLLKEPLFEKLDYIRKTIIEDTSQSIRMLNNYTKQKFTYEFLSKYDVANFVLGKYCDCCAHLEAAGFSVMKASIIHPFCQNLVIRNNKGEIIAKSTLYINQKERYGLFNTIEIAENIPNEDKELIYQKYIEAVSLFAQKYNENNPDCKLKQINVGIHSNDLLIELEKYTKEAKTLLKGLDFSIYGNLSSTHEGDWKQGQRILWKNKNQSK